MRGGSLVGHRIQDYSSKKKVLFPQCRRSAWRVPKAGGCPCCGGRRPGHLVRPDVPADVVFGAPRKANGGEQVSTYRQLGTPGREARTPLGRCDPRTIPVRPRALRFSYISVLLAVAASRRRQGLRRILIHLRGGVAGVWVCRCPVPSSLRASPLSIVVGLPVRRLISRCGIPRLVTHSTYWSQWGRRRSTISRFTSWEKPPNRETGFLCCSW
jgi:hypothetical protein